MDWFSCFWLQSKHVIIKAMRDMPLKKSNTRGKYCPLIKKAVLQSILYVNKVIFNYKVSNIMSVSDQIEHSRSVYFVVKVTWERYSNMWEEPDNGWESGALLTASGSRSSWGVLALQCRSYSCSDRCVPSAHTGGCWERQRVCVWETQYNPATVTSQSQEFCDKLFFSLSKEQCFLVWKGLLIEQRRACRAQVTVTN